MGLVSDSQIEQRVLLLAPTRRDAEITKGLLTAAGLNCFTCQNLSELSREVLSGAGAILLTEEAIGAPNIDELVNALEAQPTWSDLPLVMLMRGGIQSPESARVLQSLRNVTLLDRPAATRSLVSAMQAAVRARQRQYQAREQIEEIRRAEALYKEIQQQLEIAIEASQLGTFHCEIPLGKILWNDRCKAHFWLPPDAEVDFDLFYSILHPDDRQRTREAVTRCVEGGSIYDIEYRTVSPQGEIRWVRATGRTFFDELGQPVEFDGTTLDITEKRNAAEDREQLLRSEQAARVESERAGRMKDEFLATLSHELRTPLNAILGWSQLIRRGDDKETLKEGLDVIERNARVQVQLIEDLLDMSRIISGKVRLDIQTVEPTSFIDTAVETVMPSADARGIRLQKIVDPKAGPIAGDPGRLQQVVWNLLSNAIKFTPKGGKVQVMLKRVDSRIEIAVSDTGQGIKPEFLPHVFERFRQADSSSTRSHGGLGLGLAIVKQLVELHGGTISAASSGPGLGSTFTVALPVLAIHRRHAAEPRNHPPAVQSGALEGKPKVLEGMTVLVVDDEPDARSLVKRLLEDCGAKVEAAGSAAEAVRLVPTVRPNVLVSDIGMPVVDGYELLRRVRALGRQQGGDVPAVALTAFARSEDRTRALMAGYLVHVSKPVEPHELIATVATVGGRTGDPNHSISAR
jgi:signal transduction histidine kinase/ActR/RegA family two-component response regulator